MRVFVTGGNGFIGSAVVRKLAARGDEVRCLLRKTSNTRRIEDLPLERVEGDIRDPAGLSGAIDGCDAVIHLACLSSWDLIASPEMDAVAVQGTRNLLEVAARKRCRRFAYVSSSLAVGASREPRLMTESSESEVPVDRFRYSCAKRQAEDYCREAARQGLDVVILNPGEVYGPNDDAMVTAGNLLDFARSWPVFVCDGGTSVAHVDDIADGIIAGLGRGRRGERYILAGQNLSVRELAALTLDILGLSKPIVTLPNGVVKSLAWLGTNLRVPLPFSPEVAPYATLYWFMDSAKARGELGVSFRPARQTLSSALSWLCQTGRLKATGDFV